MAAHRYWSILIKDTSVSGGTPAIAELQMAESTFGANACVGGTASATSSFGSSLPAGAFDGTFYTDNGAALWSANAVASTTNQRLAYDFGAGNTKDIKSLRILARKTEGVGGGPGQAPAIFDVCSSDDGTTWTVEWSVTGSTGWADYELRQFHKTAPSLAGSPHGTHAYWRLALLKSGASAYAGSEMEFRATPGGADQANSGTASAFQSFGGSPGTFDETKLFDNTTTTLWSSTNTTDPAWVQYHFASAVSVAEVNWTARNDSNFAQSPTSALVLWSDDGTHWNMAWQGTASFTAAAQSKSFTDPNYTVAAWNPSDRGTVVLSNNNLTATGGDASNNAVRANSPQFAGLFYVEFATNFGSLGSSETGVGVAGPGAPRANLAGGLGRAVASKSGTIYVNGTNVGSTGVSGATTVDMAVDFTHSMIWFRANGGNWNNNVSNDPASNVGGIDISSCRGAGLFPIAVTDSTTDVLTANFGNSAFARTAPTGYTKGWPVFQGNIAVDGAACNNAQFTSGSSSQTIQISTSGVDRTVLVAVSIEKTPAPSVTSITDTAGLTWALRKRYVFGSSSGLALELWWAHAPTALSGDTITVTTSGAIDGATLATGAVYGPNVSVSAPFDADASLPATNSALSATAPTVGPFAVQGESMVVALYGAGQQAPSGSAVAPGTGYAVLGSRRDPNAGLWSFITLEGKYQSAAATGLTATTAATSAANYGMIADAIAAVPPSPKARITQDYAEVLRTDADYTTAVRSTQDYAEVLRTDGDMIGTVRSTQEFAEVLRSDADVPSATRITQEYAEVLRTDGNMIGTLRSTQEFAEVLRSDADASTRVTQEFAEVLRTDANMIGTLRSTQDYAEVLRTDADLAPVARLSEIYAETLIQDFPVAPHAKKRRVITVAQA